MLYNSFIRIGNIMFFKIRAFAYAAVWMCFAISALAAEPPKVVEAIAVKPTTIVKNVKLIGVLKSKKEAHISSTIAGVVQDIIAKEGAPARKGALLAYLRNDELKRAYELALSNARVAKKQFERVKKLYQDKDVSKEALEEAETKWSHANIAASSAKTALDQSEFRAPFDGTCGVFRVSEGSYVKSGDEIVAFFDSKNLVLEFSIPEKLIPKVEAGTEVFALQHASKVLSVQRAIDPVTHMGLAHAAIEECKRCLIGAHVDVGIVVDKREKALGVPAEALFLKDGLQYVYIVRKGKAVLARVEVGLRGDSLVEITKGILSGDVVVTLGRNKLREGSEVKVHP